MYGITYKNRMVCADVATDHLFYATVSTLIRFVFPDIPFVIPPVTIIRSPDFSPKVDIALFFAA